MRKWQRLLDECCRSVEDLQGMLGLDADEMEKLHGIEEKYPVCVPDYYLGLIDPADRQDPIRKMAIPDSMEFSEGGSADTSGEGDNTVLQGMQHKYSQTALMYAA